MKTLVAVCSLIAALCAGHARAQQYEVAPAGTTAFITEIVILPGTQFTLDIYLTNATSVATAGGVWIDFSGSTDNLSYVNAQVAVPPWDFAFSTLVVPEPGTILVAAQNSLGVYPDGDGNIPICTITFECMGPGDATVVMSTIPGVQTWLPSPPYDDDLISERTFTFHQFVDSDSDGIPDFSDNCPNLYNPLQEDTFPPQGNGIGDACDCEGDFNCDGNVDASDVTAFLADFGRSQFNRPCSIEDPCSGDFSCDGDVDAADVTKFLKDFGRSQYNNPCPECNPGIFWCVYDE